MNLTAAEWLAVARREYLEDFVRAGGAAVKCLVPLDEHCATELRGGLRLAAAEGGYQFALVDAVATRIHQVEQLFFTVARELEWDALARAFLRQLLAERGLELPTGGDELRLTSIAELNQVPEPVLRTQIELWLGKQVFLDYGMSQEFRLAMIQLCRAQLYPGDDPALTNAIKEWLRGELRLISGLKRVQIFQKIARHNARHMLVSLVHWLALAGRSGLVLALDVSRYLDARRPAERESGNYYSVAATLDAYEVLRQFVDGTDELERCFIVILSGPEFLSEERRGLRSYQALYMRLADEVRNRYRPNPLAALQRISCGATDVSDADPGESGAVSRSAPEPASAAQRDER